MWNIQLVGFLTIVYTNFILTNDIFDIYFTRANCVDHNNDLCKNPFCDVKRFRNNSNLLNVGCEVVYSPTVFSRATIYYKYGHRYKPFVVNFTFNVCDLLKADYKTRQDVNMFVAPVNKYSNAIRPCPYEGNYSLENFPATALALPPLVPAGDYRLDFRIFNGKNQTLIFPRIYFTIKAKGKHILEMG